MDQPDIKTTNVQRVLAFLKALKTKLPQLERNIEQLEAAGRSAHLYQGRWPTQPLEQTVRPLTSADIEHGLASVAAWGRQVMTRLETLHRRTEPPSNEDLDWLRTRLRELSTLCDEERAEVEKAQQTRPQSLRRSFEPGATPGFIHLAGRSLGLDSKRPRGPLSTVPPGSNLDDLLGPLAQHMVSDDDIPLLSGRSVLVADDDPDVRGLFEKTLRKIGMNVRTVKDGQAALEALRESPPDVLITDIFMPRVDGWELLARLRRDFASCHIPTIILSWKEDLLERVKDLKAGASGYMLKEADRKQILYTVARALLPRLTLERRIVEEEELMGRVERVGVLPLLATAMQLRKSCRVHITEHWNFYEAHIADGEIVAVTRTATDGSFSSGQKALERLVGVATGRFAVIPPSASTPKRQIDGGTWNSIDIATEKLTSLVSRLVDTGFTENTKLVIDDEEATTYGRILPPSLGALLAKLRGGKALRDIVLESDSSADVLETLLVDLVRAGVIVDVRSETGTTIPPMPLSTPTKAQSDQPSSSQPSETASLSPEAFALPADHPEQAEYTEHLEALERKMRFYRGAAVVLLVLGLSLATSLAINVWRNYSPPSVKSPTDPTSAPPLETTTQEAMGKP